MKILIIGNGGREHALTWKMARSPRVHEVLVAPGNAGTALEPKTRNVAVGTHDIDGLVALALTERPDLTVIGPEAPLVAGLADRLQAAGLACLGPTRDGARLEGSKAFTKAFLARHHIPTAAGATVTTEAEALAYIDAHPGPLVVKADGLAAGKGVVVATDSAQAKAAAQSMLRGAFGAAGSTLVIEECLAGVEASYIILTDGRSYVAFPTSEDHKRRDDGDRGPNTGGMGAFSPASAMTPEREAVVRRTIIEPTLAGLRADGCRYTGFLYAGLMITADGPKVLEFNCRFGDPETQPIMMRLTSDLVPLIQAAVRGELAGACVDLDPRPALCVVMAAGGYPGESAGGKLITGLGEDTPDCKIFHAGTRPTPQGPVTNGGRVLGVAALGADLNAARTAAYVRAQNVHFEGAQFRRDIGNRRPPGDFGSA
ncbi:MAG: phosphoribosylamine--glycine ligase [Gammaproteobacteria bacterium]|nr:phosphoribosylamine--glycine ligase [Gammaproteobacteria bacterium]